MSNIKAALIGVAAVAAMVVPGLVSAQSYYPYVQMQIVTQTQSGTPWPASPAIVTVFAPNASLGGYPTSVGSASYTSNFQNDTRIVTFTPGSYSVSVAPLSGYTYSYSSGCQGTAYQGSGLLSCTITALNGSSSIGAGQLLVYTNINSYSSFGGTLPSNFFLTVSGNAPSPATVAVSNNSSGTSVNLEPGTFSVNAPQLPGWQVSENGTCQGTIQSGQSLSCSVTYTYGGGNYYGYPYNQPLSCMPAYQQVGQGQNAEFTAVGGTGVYNWTTPERNYPNVGAVLNTMLYGSGTQTVVVSSGSQTATCMVDVGTGSAAGTSGTAQTGSGDPTYSAPNLPNTGFAPQAPGMAAAFAAVMLLGFALLLTPYVRRVLKILA